MPSAHEIGLQDGVRIAFLVSGLGVTRTVIRLVRRGPRHGAEPLVRPRQRRLSVARAALGHAIVALILWSFYQAGGWTAESVGVSTRVSPVVALLTGFGEFYLYSLIRRSVLTVLPLPIGYWQAALRVVALLTPRDRARRIVLTALLVAINPIIEELLFRGLLVHQFAMIDGPLWLAVSLGAVMTVSNHAYQGRLFVLEHLVFYACVVALLYSPVGILGAIGFHFGGDLFPVLRYGRNIATYRTLRRADRARTRAARK